MEIRLVKKEDSRFDISRVYEESWKYAYNTIIPQDYLNSIPEGKWAQHIDSPGVYSLILVKSGEIIGTSSYCSARLPDMKGYGEIISIYLLPEYIGKGYGKKLIQASLEKLYQLGYQNVFLWVLKENKRARRFYEKIGFRFDGKILKEWIGGKELKEVRYILNKR
ncbi:MAG: GNAT family N-acetyltransferase [Firmicutes bacterium]|nr:GNAT family N-acetyltransferase [Bacillota bacterium]